MLGRGYDMTTVFIRIYDTIRYTFDMCNNKVYLLTYLLTLGYTY